MTPLTELEIKKAAVKYLRAHYRYRPFSGQVISTIDMRGEGGIIADGYLAFQQRDGRSFVATMEATSFGTQEEVKFELQQQQLNWDAAATSSFLGSGGMLFLSYLHFYFTPQWGIFSGIAVAFALWAIGFVLYKLLMVRLKRYRTIYAIEQFKQYHADEQWVAIGEDVFPHFEDKYYRELRRQCVINGFGLLLISREGHSRVLVTPAREEVFHHGRRVIAFLPLDEVTKRVRQMKDNPWIKSFTSKIKAGANLRNWAVNTLKLRRFKRPYTRQMGICLLSAFITGVVLYVDWQHRPVIYVNEKTYVRKMERKAKIAQREPLEYIVDVPPIPFDTLLPPPLEVLLEERQARMEDFRDPANSIALVTVSKDNKWGTFYNCERFRDAFGGKYIVAGDAYADLGSTKKRMAAFRKALAPANALWMGCFDEQNQEYLVFLDMAYSDSLEAAKKLLDYQKKLRKNKINAALHLEKLPQLIKD